MCEWILAVWCSVSPETVVKSFKVTGIYNEMDGSGDFMIFDGEGESESNDNGDDSSVISYSEWHGHVSEL